MAMTEEKLRGQLRYEIDLQSGLVQQPMRSQLMKGDKNANTVVVDLKNGSETVDLADVFVLGSFISPDGGAELPLVGEANGNEASVTLPDECYAVPGYFELDIKLKVGETERTVLSITGNVLSKGSGAYIDVGNVIPSIDDIVAQYAEMKRVTEETQEAAAAANDAAEHAPYVDTSSGHWMAWNKEERKYVDTGVPATGPNGDTPHIGANGNWFVGDTDTGVKAQGPKGADGTMTFSDLTDEQKESLRGPEGKQGPQGPAPERGVDYWTEYDIAQIKAYVDDAILNGAW